MEMRWRQPGHAAAGGSASDRRAGTHLPGGLETMEGAPRQAESWSPHTTQTPMKETATPQPHFLAPARCGKACGEALGAL